MLWSSSLAHVCSSFDSYYSTKTGLKLQVFQPQLAPSSLGQHFFSASSPSSFLWHWELKPGPHIHYGRAVIYDICLSPGKIFLIPLSCSLFFVLRFIYFYFLCMSILHPCICLPHTGYYRCWDRTWDLQPLHCHFPLLQICAANTDLSYVSLTLSSHSNWGIKTEFMNYLSCLFIYTVLILFSSPVLFSIAWYYIDFTVSFKIPIRGT